jgi:hypothetical protein
MQIIKTKELPRDVQALLLDHDFRRSEVRLHPCTEFTCPTSYCDYNILTLLVYNQKTGESKAARSGHYESVMNWTLEERAMASGKLRSQIPDASIWFFVLETYPSPRCEVYCHPTAIAKALDKPKVELTRKQKIVLFVTRSTSAPYRRDEAASYGISNKEFFTLKAELYGLRLMTKVGSLTLEGKNAALGLHFNTWEEK